jgi:glycosyltransferase involved in cell wall biosynthesis
MSDQLKIAIFTPSFLPKRSGAEIFHHNLALRLLAAGHKPTLIIPRANVRELTKQQWRLPYPTLPYPANLWSWFKRSPRLAFTLNSLCLSRLQRQHDFDIWHGVVSYPTGVCLIAWNGGRHAVPYLVRGVGDDIVSAAEHGVGLRRDPLIDRLIRENLPRAQAVVSLSNQISREYEALGVPHDKIHCIPNAVDSLRFAEPFDRLTTRRKLGIADETIFFLSVGRNHAQKDFPSLLRAAAALKRNTARPFRLMIAGRDTSKLSEQVAQLELTNEVILRESTPDKHEGRMQLPSDEMISWYRSADIFVMSSILEGFSSALLEAMAAGLPIIVTDTPACREVVRENENAVIVPCRDSVSLSAAMARLSSDSELRQRYAAKSRELSSQYTWERVVSDYLALYRSLIRACHAP